MFGSAAGGREDSCFEIESFGSGVEFGSAVEAISSDKIKHR